jgi:transposase
VETIWNSVADERPNHESRALDSSTHSSLGYRSGSPGLFFGVSDCEGHFGACLPESQAKNQQLLQALAAARKNSRNSSKRPSSDIVKPPPRPLGKGKRRKIGAQPGHPKHEHLAFTLAQIDHHISYELEHCPVDPSHRLVALADQQKTTQQVELVEQPFVVTEHTAQGYWCEGCQCIHYAAFPAEVVAGGLCGPRLTSLVCYLKGKLHGSYSGIQDFFRDVLSLEVSRGYLAKLNQKAAQGRLQHLLSPQRDRGDHRVQTARGYARRASKEAPGREVYAG